MPSVRLIEPAVPTTGNGSSRIPEANAVQRVFAHGKELGEDLLGWIDLRIQKEKIEVTEVINEKVNMAADMAIAGVLAALGGLFLLVAAALGLGHLLGHPAWGFLIVGAVFVVAGVIVFMTKPTLKDLRKPGIVAEEHLSPNAPQGKPHLEPVKTKKGGAA